VRIERSLGTACTLVWAALASGQTALPIPHPIDGYLVTKEENSCLECHDRPRDIGKRQAKGQPLPAPATHYGKLEGKKPPVADAHFNCTSCHKPK
jgi:nitrate reductase cytochrome c-type subunit